MRAGNRKRFCTTLLVGAAALSLGCEGGKEDKSDCGSIHANVSERHLFLLPVRWPRPSPSNKRFSQSRLLPRRFRRTIHRLPRKSHSAKSYSSTAAFRPLAPQLTAPPLTPRPRSPTRAPPRFTHQCNKNLSHPPALIPHH